MKLKFFAALLTTSFAYLQINAQTTSKATADISLSSPKLKLEWVSKTDGWHLNKIMAGSRLLTDPSGAYTVIFNSVSPHQGRVDLNLEGNSLSFYPAAAIKGNDGTITFTQKLRAANTTVLWKIDPDYPTDIQVEFRLTANIDGFFSIASPTIAVVKPANLAWGMVPGNWYGREVQPDLELSTRYSMGLPAVPVLAKERTTMTLCPLITTKDGVTMAVIPDPDTAGDPWESDSYSRLINKVAMSTMDRHNNLTPVAYAPVLGQPGSKLKAGETVVFKFRYSIQAGDWFPVFRHAAEDIYQFSELLKMQRQKVSLADRLGLLQKHLQDDKVSAWNTRIAEGLQIGANGGKNADIGVMEMLAKINNDSVMQRRLPYVRNYKLAQQRMTPGFFQYAAQGEYPSKDGFTSEIGNWIEPMYTTYYTLIDIGNMLLFQPKDVELRKRLALAADKMISWQHPAGNWDVAYDNFSHQLTFPRLQDLRPTWYGLLVAYRILGDKKYLEAAQKGAQWQLKNGVEKGFYLGVCGDARNIWDFATAQTAQAYLDLYDVTKNINYKNAAIEAGKIYTTSIFTHPIASTKIKTVNGVKFEDWEINQTGLSVEHIKGTADSAGPILISSFTGLFVRLYELTNETLFLDMARGAARGRNAFMDAGSGQTIYYWNDVDKVEKRVKATPHHAYWQIGWITDYLLSEVHMRSKGKVSFPRGFITPKVGPHEAYGFAPGIVFGKNASLIMTPGLAKSNNPYLEYITAVADNKFYLLVLNQSPVAQSGEIALDLRLAGKPKNLKWTAETALQGDFTKISRNAGKLELEVPAWGMNVIELNTSH
jgi:hypothetical protein